MGKVRDVHRKPGWVEGDAADFLGLSDEESLLIDLKITTAMAIRRLRAAEDHAGAARRDGPRGSIAGGENRELLAPGNA